MMCEEGSDFFLNRMSYATLAPYLDSKQTEKNKTNLAMWLVQYHLNRLFSTIYSSIQF